MKDMRIKVAWAMLGAVLSLLGTAQLALASTAHVSSTASLPL
jgi:hypothetical protein